MQPVPVPQRPPRAIPLPLFIGVVVGVYGTAAIISALAIGKGYENVQRWSLFNIGCDVAAGTLITYAMFAVANRLYGWHRTLMLVSASLYSSNLLFMLARPAISLLLLRSHEAGDDSYKVLQWIWIGQGFLVFLALVGMTIAVRAWQRVPIAAVLLLVMNLLIGWIPGLNEWLRDIFREHEKLGWLYWVLREVGFGFAILWVMWRIPHATPDPRVSAGGMRIAASSIIGRVLVAVVLALMTAGMIKSESTAKAMMLIAPSLVIISMLVCAWGLLRAEAWAPIGFPRIRFVIGATLTAWWAGVQLGQIEELAQSWRPDDMDPAMWVFAGPLIAGIGLVLVGFAISDFATQRGNAALQSAATSRTIIVILCSLAGVGLQYMFTKAHTPSSALTLGVLAVLASVSALVMMSTLLFQASTTMEESGIPNARVR